MYNIYTYEKRLKEEKDRSAKKSLEKSFEDKRKGKLILTIRES
jgi:hypothetical protein